MKTHQVKSILSENLKATSAGQTFKRSTSRKKRMCWKCQQNKSTIGGHIKTWAGGPMKFICKECKDAKLKDKSNEVENH